MMGYITAKLQNSPFCVHPITSNTYECLFAICLLLFSWEIFQGKYVASIVEGKGNKEDSLGMKNLKATM